MIPLKPKSSQCPRVKDYDDHILSADRAESKQFTEVSVRNL